MSASASHGASGRSTAENYECGFVPVIPAPLARELAESAKLRPGERVLDVACGTGVVARRAAETVGPMGTVVGVDVDPDMIEVARRISRSTLPEIRWERADATSLPVEDASFDAVLSQLGLMLVADKEAAAREMFRAIAAGGRLALNVPGRLQPLMQSMGEALARHLDPRLQGFVEAVFSLHDMKTVRALLERAGFDDVAVDTRDHVFDLPSPADFLWQYVYATPMGSLVGAAPEAVRASLERELVERWQPYVDGDGMRYEQPIVWATARA